MCVAAMRLRRLVLRGASQAIKVIARIYRNNPQSSHIRHSALRVSLVGAIEKQGFFFGKFT